MSQKLRNSTRVTKKLTNPPSVATASALRSKLPVPPRAARPPSPAASTAPPAVDQFAPKVTLPPLNLPSAMSLPNWALDFQAKLRQFDEQFVRYNDRLQEVESLAEANARLQRELTDAQQLISQLQAEVAHLRNSRATSPLAPGTSAAPTSAPTSASAPSPVSAVSSEDVRMTDSGLPALSVGSHGTSASRYASDDTATASAPASAKTNKSYSSVAAKPATTTTSSSAAKKNGKRSRKPFPRQVASAARQFTAAPEDSDPGFQYLYLPSRHKETLPRLRAKLAVLKINNWRVLDIHFPARHVVALLVHNDYASDLRALFAVAGITPLSDFDPLDPKHLDDPRLVSLTTDELVQKALSVHQGRLQRALKFIRSIPIRHAVAADFCARAWISEDQLREIRKSGSFTVV
ncbi:MAG: hypothetical protein EXX96DRAFT_537536, partial [Benjaminiella poitrasii]